MSINSFKATTILGLHTDKCIVMASDGQVTAGSAVVKSNACKIRAFKKEKVIVGMAGSLADAMMMFSMFEDGMKDFSGQALRTCIEIIKKWRSDRSLRSLEASLLVGSVDGIITMSGSGDVIEHNSGIASIGSGSNFALSAALALKEHTKLAPKKIVEASMSIAGDMCVYTNKQLSIEEIVF